MEPEIVAALDTAIRSSSTADDLRVMQWLLSSLPAEARTRLEGVLLERLGELTNGSNHRDGGLQFNGPH